MGREDVRFADAKRQILPAGQNRRMNEENGPEEI